MSSNDFRVWWTQHSRGLTLTEWFVIVLSVLLALAMQGCATPSALSGLQTISGYTTLVGDRNWWQWQHGQVHELVD